MTEDSFSILPYVVARSFDDDFDDIQDHFMDWMENYAKVYQPNHRSNVDGYQSPDDFYLEKSFTPFLNYLSDRILSLLEVYYKNELVEVNFQPRLANMWFNINYVECYNVRHTHPGSSIAGVLYINVPDNSGGITFHHLDEHNLSLTQQTCFSVEPDDGLMILFPASLAHNVDRNLSDGKEPRMSIAFNLYEYYHEDT